MTALYAFVHIEKTAGRTVRAVLLRSFGAGHCEIRTPYAKRLPEVNDRRVAVTGDDLRKGRDASIDYFVAQYRTMLEENLEAYIANFDRYMNPAQNGSG